MSDLYLIEPTIEMEVSAMQYRQEYIAYGETYINGSLGFISYTKYAEWLKEVISAYYKETSVINVPATTYFTVRRNDNKIVGSIQLRHELDDDLCKRGGHIGYGIRPAERGKGYATKQLSLVLEKAKKIGLSRVMISCDQTNLASSKVALNNGAKLEWEGYDEEDGNIQVYWIDL